MLPGQAIGIRLLATSTEEDLVAKSELFLMHRKHTTEIGLTLVVRMYSSRGQSSSAHFNLTLATSICFGRVEHVDAVLPRGLQIMLDDIAFLSAAIGKPSFQREDGNFQTSRSKVMEDHVLGVVR
jgi:hypothetical protein